VCQFHIRPAKSKKRFGADSRGKEPAPDSPELDGRPRIITRLLAQLGVRSKGSFVLWKRVIGDSSMFESKESRDAFNFVRDFILANAPPGAVDRAAFSLIDLPAAEVDRSIVAMCDAVEAGLARAGPAPSSAVVAFSIPFVAGEMIRARLREIESQRGYA
jgi:hypothetical protein